MKQVLYFIVLFLLCFNFAEVHAQTYADLPGPENVLVVYKTPDPNNEADTLSRAVMRYYQTARGIPAGNVVGLGSLDTLTTVTHNGVTHTQSNFC